MGGIDGIAETADVLAGLDRDAVKRLLFDLIAIPSYGADEDAIVRYLVKRFQAQGIPCRVTELDGKGLNVVAEIGRGSKRIVLNSHLDVVPPGDPGAWATDPFTPIEKDGLVFGRGAEDAKGCLAAMIVAFEELAKRGPSLPARVALMAVGGEERGGVGSKAEVAKGFAADAAIVGESTELQPMMAHKGVLRLEVETVGRAAHASDPEAGINAVVAMAPVISALDKLAAQVRRRSEKHTGHASLVISTISGGSALNVIPERCIISIDRRVLPNETETEATREIVDVVNRALPVELKAKVSVRKVRFVPPALTDPGEAIVAAAEKAASAVLGRPAPAVGFPATCDMTYLANDARIPTVILGPGSLDVAHQANEYIALDQVVLAARIYMKVIDYWLAG